VPDSGEVDTDNYRFDPEVVRTIEVRPRRAASGGVLVTANQPQPRNRRRETITIRGPFPYKGLITSSDAPLGVRIDPIRGFGFTETVTLTDLLENHVIRGGVFLNPTELKNSDLFLEYHNLAHRIDYGVRIDRNSLYVNSPGEVVQKNRFTRLGLSASYPLSVTSRFTVSPSYTLTRSLDLQTLTQADVVSDYAGLRGEFVYDDTRTNGMNMVEGTRFKARFDAYGGIRSSKESFTRLTIDLRRYQKLHRDLVLAVRLSYGMSGGGSPKQSALGGMENWYNNDKEPVATNPLVVPAVRPTGTPDYRNLFFLDVVTNLRGFRLGKLVGTSHLLFNAELRLPLVKYLSRGTITSNFLRNLQLVAFTDVGTAWSGGQGPFSRSNSLNTDVYNRGPFYAVVNNFKNPFLIGYGAGVRTMLLGYYVKFDYAWGLENKVVARPIAYLTLGYDF
jgi:outer membrane protein assembly factor BamA